MMFFRLATPVSYVMNLHGSLGDVQLIGDYLVRRTEHEAIQDCSLPIGQLKHVTYQVDNEAIVIPETIDCIRALTGLETDGAASIAKTDRSLGIVKSFLPASARRGGGPLDADVRVPSRVTTH